MNARQLLALLALSALWGGSYLFIRIATPSFGPVALMAVRMLIATTVLGLYALLRGERPPLREHWRGFLFVGLVGNSLPQVLIAAAALHLPTGLTATINSTLPMFTLLVSAVWLKQPIAGRQVIGLLLGLVGVATLVGLGPVPVNATTVGATVLLLLAALSYGVGAVYSKARLAGAAPFVTSLYSLMFAALWLMPVAPFALPAAMPPPAAIVSAVLLGILSTAVTLPLYFYLINTAGPTKATLSTYLVPAFSVLLGWLILQENIGLGSFVGLAMVLVSVFLVTRPAPPAPGARSASAVAD